MKDRGIAGEKKETAAGEKHLIRRQGNSKISADPDDKDQKN